MLSLPEAARSLGLAPATLRQQIKKRKLKAHKMGATWYVSPLEVDRYRNEQLRRKGDA